MRKSYAGRVAAGVAIVSASAVMMGAGPAGATAPAKIYACYSNSTGEMFRVTSTTTCPSGETKIDWNVAGPQGPQGPQGAKGATGTKGATGPQGAKGPQGVAGPQGSRGAQGATGSQGARGPKGATGSPGVKGPTGAAGAQGARGAQGAAGARGAAGPQGPTGPQGAIGTTRAGIPHEYNFESGGSITLSQSEMSASKIVATVTPVAGFYNVTATGTLDSHGDIMRCSVAAMSSRGAFKSKTPLGDAEGGATTAETGVVSVRTGSAIVEICGGVSLEGGEFFPATMHNPTLTAIGVTHASGTVNLGPLRSATHKSAGGHPVNTFTNQAKPLPQR